MSTHASQNNSKEDKTTATTGEKQNSGKTSENGEERPKRGKAYELEKLQREKFATKPKKAQHGRPLKLVTNFHEIRVNSGKDDIYKYAIQITPEVAITGKLTGQVIRACREQLNEKFNQKHYLAHQSNIYSCQNITDEMKFECEVDGQKYEMSLKACQKIEPDSNESQQFYGIFFKMLMKTMEFEIVGRNCFEPAKGKRVRDLEIWPGFYTAMNFLEKGKLLQIDITSKVVRKDNCLDHVKSIMDKFNDDRDRVNEELRGMGVVTSYCKSGKKHTYKVERIDFDKNPLDTFERKEGEISFKEYLYKQHNKQIGDDHQPLFVVKDSKTGRENYLIPEACEMTGMTDQHRADFGLMKEMSQHLHKRADDRVKMSQDLVQQLSRQKKVAELLKKWQVEINPKPFAASGDIIESGDIMMDKNVQPFKADIDTNQFDRKIQSKMYKQQNLEKWCIIHTQRGSREANQFMNTIKDVLGQFNFNAKPPAMFEIQGRDNDFANWEKLIKAKINPQVQFIVFILPGAKKNGVCYKDIKQLLFQTIPVPSQVVLQSTISRGKNLRSIVNKILIQMNAKMSGIPWSISKMPFTDKPTSVIAYDYAKKSSNKHVLGLVASINREFNRFFSKTKMQNDEIGNSIQSVFEDAFNAFKASNGIFPKRIIIYRDGVGEGQKLAMFDAEMPQIRQAIESIPDMKGCQIIFVMVNKRVKTKFVQPNGNQLNVPQPGTVIDSDITKSGLYDFFIVSTHCRQGVPTPTHYSVLLDEVKSDPKDIQQLSYKLTYLYYNFSGAVKTPAPLRYAERLASMVSEQKEQDQATHKHYDKINSLFYI